MIVYKLLSVHRLRFLFFHIQGFESNTSMLFLIVLSIYVKNIRNAPYFHLYSEYSMFYDTKKYLQQALFGTQ